MAKTYSSRQTRRRARSDGKSGKSKRASPATSPKSDQLGFCRSPLPKEEWDELLGEFSDVLGDAETACFALQAMEEDLGPGVGPPISTLGRSMKALKRVYSRFDHAIMALEEEVPRG